ncbi:MAG: hypothetical protein CO031_01930 [Candidatus Nealsonbacteria bacterium CG_4_9_14_0_2_um_filter_37_38]|uniref:diphosphoinositol-polyphosphate diphosphatase n=1 Tax=Candidatus Nealsonbacteria bacterium CG_4_10_14_0_8_um_filter_37_14 TaxID=1974684 RepID=A0A2M7R5Y7_9BACT|nr:MAG: hypothetical protein COV63_03445 [Candidatus Nealsonbacteria bacterium CG11_big_fil_rev_8_21_14_0_20_37_68]PIW92071.1 MAG: hypothetical protein COZ89_02060 [Candidatus Nealsonbacteria bacterium CG_4_8_14_3_um_filter_37_23]PIY88902.1 MAG: hypothetical protein COY73_02520 [Candidatus Nealsonbacteria bacterium CG_4_10_14_0_8_um_filter_37_14]PJC51571.1 MAG: hypothetical protein CO031_01930 [Candidatus Nealsonbacteria bacterium CG_4_9_14_0_2_um_filter_37_38]
MKAGQNLYNFTKISDELYKSGQPDLSLLYFLKENCQIKTIVNLRTKIENFEKDFVQNQGIYLLHIPLLFFLRNPKEKDILRFLELFNDSQKCPVLVHCRNGKDRTGMMVALFRLLYQNWPIQKVLEEMKQNRVNFYWKLSIQFRWKGLKNIWKS